MVEARSAPEEITTRADLGRALSELRTRAGRTVRELARALDVPVATIGDYCAGRHLPGPAQERVYVGLLAECGVTQAGEVQAWLEALWRCRRTSDRRTARSAAPHPGLEPFTEEDAPRFFGREPAVAAVLGALGDVVAAGGGMVALVGASGAGKSSVLRAGVMAEVRAGALAQPGTTAWSARWCTPGDDPVGALEEVLGAVGAPGAPALVVVDQLEELLAPEVPPAVRGEALARLAGWAGPGRLVVVGLRADFYEVAVREPVLHRALADHQVLLGPMTDDQLRRAIVGPARAVGAAVEDGLVEVLLKDLAARAADGSTHEPGALPLLSHALRSTWARSRTNALTLEGYWAAGGVAGAVRQSAEDLYRSLGDDEQQIARRILLRLVRVSEDAPPTRRRVGRCELAALEDGPAPGVVDKVLERFVEARLVTVDAEQVTLSHEALLTAWPRLAGWLAEDLTGLQLRHRLSDVTSAWLASGRDDGLLLRGSRLGAYQELLAVPAHRAELNAAEVELVETSRARADAEAATERRRNRRVRVLLAVSMVLLVGVAALAAYGLQARAEAAAARDAAQSRQLAIEASQLAARAPALAAQLAVAGYRLSPTVEARSALLDATAGPLATRLVGAPGSDFVAVGRHGRLLAVARSGGGVVDLYALVGPATRLVARLAAGPAGPSVFAVAVDPTGRVLAFGGSGKAVVLYDVADPSRPRRLAVLAGPTNTVYSVAFSPSGDQLAAAGADGEVHRWRLAPDGRATAERALPATGRAVLKAVAYAPSGRLLVAGGAGGLLDEWPAGASRPVAVTQPGGAAVESVAFSPAGGLLATGADDGVVRRYRVGRGARLAPVAGALPTFGSIAYAVAFSPSGRFLAASDAVGTIRLFSTAGWSVEATLRDPNPVTSLAFDRSAQALVTGDGAGVTTRWPIPLPAMVRAPGNIYFFAPDRPAGLVAAVSGGTAGDVGFWRVTPDRPARLVASVDPPARFGPVAGSGAVSPNGRLLALANAEGAVQLYGIAHLAHPVALGRPLLGDPPFVEQLAFSPGGAVLVAGNDGGTVRRWDVTDPRHPVALPTLTGPKGPVMAVAFTPNGRLLAAASADGGVYLYDVARPAHPRLLARLGGFSSYVFALAVTPNGRVLAAGSGDRTIQLWSLADPRHPVRLARLTGPTSYVYQLAVSPAGRLLAAATTDGSVWVWSLADPAAPVVVDDLRAASGSLFAVAFTDGGRQLLAGGTDRVLHRWIVSPARAAAQICQRAGSPVSTTEWSEYASGTPYRPPCP